jgi:hypothetical protein
MSITLLVIKIHFVATRLLILYDESPNLYDSNSHRNLKTNNNYDNYVSYYT